jgi:hypothetical protein
LPEVLVSDNGPQFVSSEFEKFCSLNGIVHLTSAVHKPSTNGQAERVVQILKSALSQAQLTKINVDTVVSRYLMMYRNTPHSTTGECPSVLLMGRRLRTRLDLMIPSVDSRVKSSQHAVLKRTESRGCRSFSVGDHVQAKNFGLGGKWKRGVIEKVLGSRHYNVRIGDQICKRHIDQLISCSVKDQCTPDVNRSVTQTMYPDPQMAFRPGPVVHEGLSERVVDTHSEKFVSNSKEATVKQNSSEVEKQLSDVPTVAPQAPIEHRYPVRENRGQMPTHLKDFKLGKK